jgi:hypothetical protein
LMEHRYREVWSLQRNNYGISNHELALTSSPNMFA